MSAFTILLIAWAGLSTILLVLLIYRGTLTMHEDDQLFLDDAEAHMKKEQDDLHARVHKLEWPVRLAGVGSVLLFLATAGVWVYEGLTKIQ